MSIFSHSLRSIYPNFRELLWNNFKNTFLVTDFAPPLSPAPLILWPNFKMLEQNLEVAMICNFWKLMNEKYRLLFSEWE